jgi:hypothetical protein
MWLKNQTHKSVIKADATMDAYNTSLHNRQKIYQGVQSISLYTVCKVD